MTDDTILCDTLDKEGSQTEDDTDDASNEPICPQSSDVCQALDIPREYMLCSDNGEFIHKCLIFLLEEAFYQLVLVCSTLHFVILHTEEITLTRTKISFLLEFALTGVSLNSNIR